MVILNKLVVVVVVIEAEHPILPDLDHFSHRTTAEFNTCFIIHSKYLYVLNMPTSS